MHRDQISYVVCTRTDFIITASCDGHVKFWKKIEEGVEFVKHFRAHLLPVTSLSTNASGSLVCTSSVDKTVKIFDVVNFDMINMLKLDFTRTAPAGSSPPVTRYHAWQLATLTHQQSKSLTVKVQTHRSMSWRNCTRSRSR